MMASDLAQVTKFTFGVSMTPETLAFLVFMFLISVAVISVVWPWDESGDMVDEVDEESQPIETLRDIQTPAPH